MFSGTIAGSMRLQLGDDLIVRLYGHRLVVVLQLVQQRLRDHRLVVVLQLVQQRLRGHRLGVGFASMIIAYCVGFSSMIIAYCRLRLHDHRILHGLRRYEHRRNMSAWASPP